MNNIVKLKEVNKEYYLGESIIFALQKVDLTISKGEFAAVCGPSGSGKTSLLNLIGIIDDATEGYVYINGEQTDSLSDNQKTELRNRFIGYIFQTFNLIPVLSALENVMLPLQIKGGLPYRSIKSKAECCLKEVGLENHTEHRPDKLSGGQRQRVAIARALVTKPLIVIADEPTANLDSKTAHSILELMKKINEKEEVTFIFSTHDQRLLDVVSRLIFIEDGRIVKEEKR